MNWPNATDYNAAVQNPQLCFRDDDLRQGQAAGDLFGLPRPHSGNFADVYQIQGRDGQSWAVKCFTRPVADLRQRYRAISEHLRQAQRHFMVEFHFLHEGICIRGQWHPLLKMRWIEGFRLNEFVREHLNKPVLMDRLAHLWLRLSCELRDAGMAHGDLQHGNVLLVPSSKSSSLALKLIDYDGMFVPALADQPSGEIGHPNYQHPQRLREGGYDRNMDRFSHLLIYTALRCLRFGGEELWHRYDNLENLLFREEDFRQPGKSRLLRELWQMPDGEVRNLVGHLVLASQARLQAVPMLDELWGEADIGVRHLSPREVARINELLRTVSAGSIPRLARIDKFPPLPNGRGSTPRRSVAEIELDAQPPEPAAARSPFNIAALTDPLVSMLSHPAWLTTLCLIALISFFVINVMVWSSAPHRVVEEEAVAPPPLVEKKEEKTIPPPPEPKPAPRKIAAPEPKPRETVPSNPKLRKEDSTPHVRLREEPPKTLSIEAGTEGELQIALDRSGYVGEVEIQLTDLPKGVTASPAVVSSDSATLTVRTKADAGKGAHRIKLLVRANKQTMEQRDIALTVAKPRGRQESVHFAALDHIELAGTLYHGWKGKKGMTVLMLHDLDSNRSSPGWKRLAQALQAEGHTVLTFDFRGRGDSKKVSAKFWAYSVNQYLSAHEPGLPPERQPKLLKGVFPSDYMPWLIEDIAAARTYLDLRHDEPEGPVNTFNLVVVGAGQASALGSLWLATEGLRYNAADASNKILLKYPEKRSILQAVWIGMADPLKFRPFGIHGWLEGAHAKPVVPITFIYGEDDIDTSTLLSVPIREKFGQPLALRGVPLSGQILLDRDAHAANQVQEYLVKTLGKLRDQGWVPRQVKTRLSLWKIPLLLSDKREHERWYIARRAGQEHLSPAPFQPLNVPPIKGLTDPVGFIPGQLEPEP